ncbi:MAG: hypothetical protein P8079_08705, partial [Gammaproteobacteria bacterium]
LPPAISMLQNMSFSTWQEQHPSTTSHLSVSNFVKWKFQALARRAGYRPLRVWTDLEALFSVHFLRSA